MQSTVILKMRGECVYHHTERGYTLFHNQFVMKGMFAGVIEPGGIFWLPHLILHLGSVDWDRSLPFLASVLGITSSCVSTSQYWEQQ